MRPLTSTLALFVLSACGGKWEAADLDGDGYTVAQGDCWENEESAGTLTSADIHPGATETWYDGFDQDCSGGSDFDKDGDGHASADSPDPSGELPSDDCWDDPDVIPDGFTAADPGDQLDASAVFPGAGETWYDGIDQDCGGEDDFDQDGDGFTSATHADGEDCFDALDDDFANDGGLDPAEVNPGVSDEWYDGTDADCAGNDDFDQDGDGWIVSEECDDEDPARYPDPNLEETWYNGIDENCDNNDGDQDGDGYYVSGYEFEIPAEYQAGDCWDDPVLEDAWSPLNGFDPLDPDDVNPGATERYYDGLDQDCDGGGDFDQDGDGFPTDLYADGSGTFGADCEDTIASAYPGATEVWYNGTDEDCAGDDDYDQDADGFDNSTDCDDEDLSINPDALEVCGNVVDEDCSGSDNDEGAFGCTPYFADADGDGFGSDDDEACLCEAEGDYTVTTDGDCDDASGSVNPDGTESCLTTADDDCDGSTNAVGAAGCTPWYTDVDNDGYGTTTSQCACEASGTYRADNNDDCNDANAAVSPGDTETCNSVDDDCDGTVDDGLPLYYADADGDTYGAGTGTCSSSGRVSTNTDCDDTLDTVYPGAPELCDGEANDCSTSGSWTADDEDDMASYVTTAGDWTDISSSFTATAGAYALNTSGTYYFCGGTFYTKLVGYNDTVDVEGLYGADETFIVSNASTGATVSVTGGAVNITGVTISGGVGSGTAPSTFGGGVIAAAGTAPTTTPTLTLTDCIVSGNSAAYGGGVAAYTSGWLKLVRTEVTSNSASTSGGGVYVAATARFTAEDSEIWDNTGTTSAGGIFLNSTATATLTGTDVHDNDTPGDGGGIYLDDGTLTMTTSYVYTNDATDDGGGIFIDTGVATCTSGGVYGNTAGNHGGGVYLSNHSTTTASFTSTSCDFGTGGTDNSTTDVTIKYSGSGYTDYTSYGATATFVCNGSTDICTP